MDRRDDMATAIGQLERLLGEIAALLARQQGNYRRDLVQLRRQLADQITTIGQVGDTMFGGSAGYETFREKFSRMRSATALHQASWPAVKIDPAAPDYHTSAAPMREANRDFIDWVRRAIVA